MRQKLTSIRSNDGRFNNGNPAQGQQGTIVTAEWLNEVQDILQDWFEEGKNALALVNAVPDHTKKNQLAEAIRGYLRNRLTDNVNFDSSDWGASAKALRTVNLKAVEAKTAADNAQRSANAAQTSANNANNNANTKVPIHGDCEMTGTKSFTYQIRIKSSDRNSDKYLRFGQNEVDSFIQNPYSDKYLQLRNNGKLQYDGKDVFVKDLQNPSWSDVENKPTTLANYGITDFKVQNLSTENLNDVMTAGIYGQPANVNATASRNYPEQQAGTLLVTNSAYGIQQEYTSYASHRKYVRGRSGETWQTWERIDGIDKVNRSGDTMTGILEIDTPNAIVRGRRNGSQGWYVGFLNSQLPDLYLGSYIHSTQLALRSNKIEANKELFVDSNKVHHAGDSRVWTKAETWGGLTVERQSKNDLMIFETNEANQFSFIRRNRTTQQNDYVIYLPKKNGTAVLDSDFEYRKIGNFEIHKFPNGTMIQTYWQNFRSGYQHNYVYSFNWAVAFVEKPRVFGNGVTGGDFAFVDRFMAEVRNQTTNTKFSYVLYDPGHEQGDWDMQFMAIGRWK